MVREITFVFSATLLSLTFANEINSSLSLSYSTFSTNFCRIPSLSILFLFLLILKSVSKIFFVILLNIGAATCPPYLPISGESIRTKQIISGSSAGKNPINEEL